MPLYVLVITALGAGRRTWQLGPEKIKNKPSRPSTGCCNFVLDRKRQTVRSRAEMPCLDVVLTGGPYEFRK